MTPIWRETSATVQPSAIATSACRSLFITCSGLCLRLAIFPPLPVQLTNITAGPEFGGQVRNSRAIETTFDTISFQELGDLLRPYLQDKRLFVSACRVVNEQFRQVVMTNSGCLSIIGPSKDVYFDQAAIFWASFYYLMFDTDTRRVKRDDILPTVKKVAPLFGLAITYCSRTRIREIG